MNKKIKIMFITGALSFGGLERVVINLCTFLNRDYFDPVVVCLKNRGVLANEIEKLGITVHDLQGNKGKLNKYFSWFFLRRIMRQEAVDIIHTHNSAAFIDGFLATLSMSGTCFVHTDHARVFPDRWRYMVAEHLASLRVDKIVAVSDELKHNLIKYEKMSPGKIQVILNGIAKARPPSFKELQLLKNELQVNGFRFIIGLGVVLTAQKGIIHLIHAAREILKTFPHTGFLIAGDGPEKQRLEAEVKRLGLTENFIFPGFRRDISSLLYLIDLYMFPSEWEGLPLAILEAMAASRCILSTDVGGIPTALTHGKSAIMVPPKRPELLAREALGLMKNEALRRKLAKSAYQAFCEQFDVRTMVKNYERLYCGVSGFEGTHHEG